MGKNAEGAEIRSSYAAGKLTQNNDNGSVLGGLIGFDSSDPHSIKSAYWDLEKGVSDPSQGAGNIPNDPGIAGLTTKQFQKGLPKGFDPRIWGQNAKVNGGFPYLKALFRR